MIHDRLYCNRGFAVATSLHTDSRCAGGLAAQSVDILFKDASLSRGLGYNACLAHFYKGADEPS